MKKILLTTTAMTLLAGAAAADVNLSGSARFGVVNTAAGTVVGHRFRINFNASGATDGGLTFGAFARINMSGGVGGNTVAGPRVWIGNDTMTLTLGNAGGATATAGNIWGCGVGFTGNCADMANPNFTWVSNSSGGAGASVIRLDFSLGSANISISGGNASGGANNDTEVAATFSLGAATVGVSWDGGAGATGGTQVHIGFDAGSANVHIGVAQSGTATGYTAAVSFGTGAGTVSVFGGNSINGAATGTNLVYGVTYSQSLGGGATAAVSYRNVAGVYVADAGVKFSF